MPRPRFTPHATWSSTRASAQDKRVERAQYRLEQLQHEAGKWVCLAAYVKLDPALEAARHKSGHIRITTKRRDGTERVIGTFLNGNVKQKVQEAER